MNLHIGTSGWSYAHWQHVLYPDNTPPADRRSYYVKEFDTVELNSSFYHWPKDSAFQSWHRRLPAGFTMSVKAPRGLTHAKKLLAPESWIAIIERGWHILGNKHGVLLVQLPPSFAYDYQRLAYFLRCLPETLRVSLEFRHESWNRQEVYDLLERHQAAYCVMSGSRLPCVLRATAPFVYLRFHGPDYHHLYAGSYSDRDLAWWAERIGEWREQGREVFAYFNNDGQGYAVNNARKLKELLQELPC